MRKITLLSMVLLMGTPALFPQTIITGKVIDSKDGLPIAGATIKVKGERSSTVSGSDGTFKIKPKSGHVLEISEIGHVSQSVTYSGTDELSVKLVPDLKALSEVVVTGVGTATSKKK